MTVRCFATAALYQQIIPSCCLQVWVLGKMLAVMPPATQASILDALDAAAGAMTTAFL